MPARREWSKTERVQDRDGAGAHGEDVAEDSADARRRALIGLDGARVVVRLDLEHRRPTLADVDGAGVLARTLQDSVAVGRQASEKRLGGLVRAVLGPEHADHPELDVVRGAVEELARVLVLVLGESYLPQPPGVYSDTHLTASDIASRTDRNSRRPSVPPSSGSAARSGCGIIPSTFPALLTIPAMLWADPLGFAAPTTRPSGRQYLNTTWPSCSSSERVAGSAK